MEIGKGPYSNCVRLNNRLTKWIMDDLESWCAQSNGEFFGHARSERKDLIERSGFVDCMGTFLHDFNPFFEQGNFTLKCFTSFCYVGQTIMISIVVVDMTESTLEGLGCVCPTIGFHATWIFILFGEKIQHSYPETLFVQKTSSFIFFFTRKMRCTIKNNEKSGYYAKKFD